MALTDSPPSPSRRASGARPDLLVRSPETAPWPPRRPSWSTVHCRSAGSYEPRGRPVAAVARWLDPVLGGLTFPAHRWQVLAQADVNGIDSHTRRVVSRLGEESYPTPGHIAEELADPGRQSALVGRGDVLDAESQLGRRRRPARPTAIAR